MLLTSCSQFHKSNCVEPQHLSQVDETALKFKWNVTQMDEISTKLKWHENKEEVDVFSYLEDAVARDDLDTVKCLVEHGANLTRTTIKTWLLDRLEHIWCVDNVLTSAWSIRMVKYLIKHGGNINQGSGKYCETLLWKAALAGNFELVKFCVRNGANVNQIYHGWPAEGMVASTALEVACEHSGSNTQSGGSDRCSKPEYVNIIKFLVANGALVNRSYSYEDAALAGAVRAKNKEVVKFLLKHGASRNMQYVLNPPPTPAEIDAVLAQDRETMDTAIPVQENKRRVSTFSTRHPNSRK
jgi:ankyrin repeat protein